MLYTKTTKKSVDEAQRDLEAAVERHGFGVLHAYDLKKTLREKGFDLPHECRILEVCNPRQASRVLAADMRFNMALPCRISVWDEDGLTHLGMVRPTSMLSIFPAAALLGGIAEEVEQATRAMIDEAA